jgi:hypothetical protein
MKIKSDQDGRFYNIEISDSNKVFSFEIEIQNGEDGAWIDYTNSDGTRYNLLTVDEGGQISNEKPKKE